MDGWPRRCLRQARRDPRTYTLVSTRGRRSALTGPPHQPEHFMRAILNFSLAAIASVLLAASGSAHAQTLAQPQVQTQTQTQAQAQASDSASAIYKPPLRGAPAEPVQAHVVPQRLSIALF